MSDYNVIVIGAGAAGLIAAGRAAELGSKVLVIEKMRSPGRKLLITGKGRCNISNDSDMENYFKNIYPNGRFLRTAFHEFFSVDMVKLLNDHGLKTQTERGNRIFPENNKAADVLASIKNWLKNLPVDFKYESKLENLLMDEDKLRGIEVLSGGKTINLYSDAVIIATGGKSYPATGSTGDGYRIAEKTGHSIVTPRPALVPLVTSGNTAGDLQGLSLKNINAVLWVEGKKVKEEFGEMLFAHFGLTGPVILSLSRDAVDSLRNKNRVEISIDLKPALDENRLDQRILRDLDENGKKQLENILKGLLPQKMIPVFLKKLELDGKKSGHQLSAKERKKLVHLLKDFRFQIIDYRGFKEAIITAGGIDTKDISSKSMESKKIKNLYFAGEVINLDGNTGGYNLQIAWSTGWLAGSKAGNGVRGKV